MLMKMRSNINLFSKKLSKAFPQESKQEVQRRSVRLWSEIKKGEISYEPGINNLKEKLQEVRRK